MELHRVGERGLLVSCADADAVRSVHAGLLGLRADGALEAVEIVPAACTVLLDGLADRAATQRLLTSWEPPVLDALAPGPLVEVPTRYDGPDLDEVARQWGLSTEEVVEIHTGTELVVAFCGFAPGFAYCTGLPEGRSVARRAEPRTRVPAGSVALAGGYSSVYPSSSPGGWQLIGSTDVRPWDPARAEPALLAPGTRVVFTRA
ncbi:MAG: 5-oxoprolinase subunit B family protein [Marmoricola sp.]